MKKILPIILTVLMAFAMSACGKSKAATAVDKKISEIGTVSLESETLVSAAEDAYEALTQEQKNEVEKYAELVAAREALEDLKLRAEAAEVDAVIDEIGEVTLAGKDSIAAARKLYEEADPAVQTYVSNVAVLEAAEAELERLEQEKQQKEQEERQKKADAVIALIDAIGEVTIDSGEKIEKAEKAYNALDADAKKLVMNSKGLTGATTKYKDLVRTKALKLLDNMREEEDKVRGLSFYYPYAWPYYDSYGYWAADIRCFVLPYLGKQGDSVWMRMICHYTGDDWVFFDKVTFAVDEKRFYKFFSYFDVTRDNEYGDVWETADIEVGESEIEILLAIANSETTIVRFEGDDHYYDFTVSEKDKEAIKQMIQVYEGLMYQ